MSTLYLQIDDLTADSYPVRLGVVDPARPGPVTLTQAGVLSAALPPAPDPAHLGTYLRDLVAGAAERPLDQLIQAAGADSVVVDVRPASLAGLPWEALDLGGNSYPFVNSGRPWSRGRWQAIGRPARWARSGCSSSSATRGTRRSGRRRSSRASTARSGPIPAGST